MNKTFSIKKAFAAIEADKARIFESSDDDNDGVIIIYYCYDDKKPKAAVGLNSEEDGFLLDSREAIKRFPQYKFLEMGK